MKKVLFVAAIAAFAFGATSCKKDYTCECTFDGETSTATVEGGKLKKKDAEDACAIIEKQGKDSGVYDEVSCEAKAK